MRFELFSKLMSENTKNGIYKSKDFMGTGIPIVKMSQQFGNRFIDSSLDGYEQIILDDKELEGYRLLENDLLFSRTSVVPEGVGMCSIIREKERDLVFESNIIRVRLNNDLVNPEFVFRYFQSPKGRGSVLSIAGGTNIKTIKASSLKDLKVPLLDRNAQNNVVEILRNYDELIENNRRRIQLLDESARLLYQEWFVHLRFPGHEQVKITDGVPEGWSIKRVDSLLGKVAKKKKIKKEEYLEDGVVPCVDQSQEFIGGYIDDEEAAITENLPVVVFGDHTRIVKFIDFPFAPGADGTQLLVPNDEEIPRDFFYFMISSINVANAFYARHFKFLKAKDVLVPEKKLMHEFSLVVKDNMLQIKLLRNQNRSLAKARDLLLPKLMSGELTV